LLALPVAVSALATLLFPGIAAADDQNTAKASSGPSSNHWVYCVTDTGVEGCYQPYGDVWYVKDTRTNGHAAVVYWQNNLNGHYYREGDCVNKLGAGRWGACNKDYREDSTVDFMVDGVGTDARYFSPELYA
jgi:hypothetical protein